MIQRFCTPGAEPDGVGKDGGAVAAIEAGDCVWNSIQDHAGAESVLVIPTDQGAGDAGGEKYALGENGD